MECQHLEANVKIKPEKVAQHSKVWKCEVCRTTDSPWLCLHCGFVGCGRYVSGHAKRHHEEQEGHAVCIECRQLSVFCYQCDDFIFNDTTTGVIDKVRAAISAHPTSEANGDIRPPSGRKRKRNRLAQSESEGEAENREGKRPLRRRGRSADPQPPQRPGCAAGLRNLGNTCFMNAVLQSLNNIKEFRSYMNELPDLADIIKERAQNGRTKRMAPGQVTRSTRDLNGELMTEELRKVLVELSTSTSAISPEALFHVIWKVVPRFRGYQQQDAHEFLRYMLDRLHTEMLTLLPEVKEASPRPVVRDSIVTSVFGGTLQNEVTCLICRTESRKHDPFLDLSLDIPDRFLQMRGKSSKDGEPPPACTLADCLNLFLDVEELADTELYYCSSCRQRQKSTKKFWIRRLPNVLCVHVKRFRWCNNYRTKVDVPLVFPVKALDMSAHLLGRAPGTRRSGTAGSQLYDLAAVIVHHGSGAGSGHYTAFASHGGSWYHFNDSSVKKADEDQVAKCKAYILFYIRREFKLPKLTS